MQKTRFVISVQGQTGTVRFSATDKDDLLRYIVFRCLGVTIKALWLNDLLRDDVSCGEQDSQSRTFCYKSPYQGNFIASAIRVSGSGEEEAREDEKKEAVQPRVQSCGKPRRSGRFLLRPSFGPVLR